MYYVIETSYTEDTKKYLIYSKNEISVMPLSTIEEAIKDFIAGNVYSLKNNEQEIGTIKFYVDKNKFYKIVSYGYTSKMESSPILIGTVTKTLSKEYMEEFKLQHPEMFI